MKQAENNEIDILVRDLAQRKRASANAQSVPQSAKATSLHLDADELSAYAEKALPLATRARYTAHLVDCDDCRKIVSQLSVAAGLPVADRVAGTETVVSTWSEKLAALLSPRMWRYAMPALVLFAVIAVGFFALRQKKEASLVAQNERAENSRAENKQLATSPAQGAPKASGNEERAGSQKQAQTMSETDSKTRERATGSTAASPTPAKDKDSSKNETAAAAPGSIPNTNLRNRQLTSRAARISIAPWSLTNPPSGR